LDLARPGVRPSGRRREFGLDGDDDEVDEVGDEAEGSDEEGEGEEELVRAAAFFAAFFRLVVGAAGGAGVGGPGCESTPSGGMETPTGTPFSPALRFFFLLFFLVVVGTDAVLDRCAAPPLSESAAIPSAIAIASSDEVVTSPAAVTVPVGIGVESIRGTST